MLRRSLVVLTVVSAVSVFVPGASAIQLKPKMNDPQSFKDVLFGMSEVRNNVDDVKCGGWRDNSSGQANGTTVSGDVPLPDISPDVPGRINADPLAFATTGVGQRGSFEFPDSAFGYLSACNITLPKNVDQDLKNLGLSIKYDDVGVDQDPNVRVEAGDGSIDINPYGWCRLKTKSSPRWCEKLFKTWLQMSAIAPRPTPNPLCPEPPKKYCFDPEFTKTCAGQECRTLRLPEFNNKMTECHQEMLGDPPVPTTVIDVPGDQYSVISSFYRHYGNPFSDWTEVKNKDQSPLTVTAGGKEWKLRVECYEYYKENDPKEKVTGPADEQCEIVILNEDEQSPKSPEWEDKNSPGEKQKDQYKPDPTIVQEDPREPRAVTDPWVPDAETNLSIVDIKKLKESQKNQADPVDITGIMGTILETKQRGGKTVPDNARTDTFNDDDHRALAKFWEAQQRELQKMVTDPTTKLIMPARFLVGLADDDPIYQYVRGVVSRSDGTVEMTLRAGSEDIGNVLESFERLSIGPIQQVRIPIVVPLVSESQLDLLIFQWKQWQQYEDRDAVSKLRPSNGGDADPIIARLQDYKTALLKTRKLRNALVVYLEKLFAPQKKIREYVADWYKQNSELLEQAAERGVQRRELKEVWRNTQAIMLEADASQMNWCSNQRYSVPVYSLLDLWWGEKGPGENRDQNYVPPADMDLESLGYIPPKNQEYDFSNMKFSREPVLVPTLWPIQVTLKLPQPPMVGAKPVDIADVPALPTIPDETIFDSFTVPDVDLPSPELIEIPVTTDLKEAIKKLTKFKTVMENMKATYERFQPSVLIPPDPEQRVGNAGKIIHVENDLKERIARLFSRWEPERKVDLAGRVARIEEEGGHPTCKEDVICMFLPPEKKTITSWQWFVPASDTDFTSFATAVKNAVLPPTEDQSPYEAPTLPVLERFFPSLAYPITIHVEKPQPVAP